MSGEIKNPKKNMPLGLILTAVIVLALYAGLTFVASGILSIDEMATSDAPIALLASKLPGIGQYAGTIVAIMAIIVVIGSLSSCIMFQPVSSMLWRKIIYSLNLLQKFIQNTKLLIFQLSYSVRLQSY